MIQELTGTDTGGVPIVSYQIDYDKGTNNVEWETIKGYHSNDLTLSTIKQSLTTNLPYRFRYRAKNIFGWGDYSEHGILVPS